MLRHCHSKEGELGEQHRGGNANGKLVIKMGWEKLKSAFVPRLDFFLIELLEVDTET